MKETKDATPACCACAALAPGPWHTPHSQGTPRPCTQPHGCQCQQKRPLKVTHFSRELHLHLPSPSAAPELLLLLHQLLITSPCAALPICLLPDAVKDSLSLEKPGFLLTGGAQFGKQSPGRRGAPRLAPRHARIPVVTAPPRTAGTARPEPCCRTHSSGTSCPGGGTAPWSGRCSRCKGSAGTQGREGGRERLQHQRCVCI